METRIFQIAHTPSPGAWVEAAEQSVCAAEPGDAGVSFAL
jgi:hypothetical protein